MAAALTSAFASRKKGNIMLIGMKSGLSNWRMAALAVGVVGCTSDLEQTPEGLEGGGREARESGEWPFVADVDAAVPVGQGESVTEKNLSPRLYARQNFKIRGSADGQPYPRIVAPNWSKYDEHRDPSVVALEGIEKNGACSENYERDFARAVKSSGHGTCSLIGWTSQDPLDCRVDVLLDPSAGGDNIWNGDCEVSIYQKPRRTREQSCLNRCGQYNSAAACQCDRACEYFGECCPDFESACF